MFAYILLIIEPLSEHEVYLTLVRSDEVDEVHPLFGKYDIIFKVSGETKEKIGSKIEKVKTLKGVSTTKTLFGF